MKYRKTLHSWVTVMLLTAGSVSLSAQVANPAPGQSKSATTSNDESEIVKMDQVLVTGSSIRGVPATVSPVIKIDASDISLTGTTNMNDLVSTLPQFTSFGTLSGTNLQVGAIFNPMQMHGQGTASTLNLLNNHRLVGTGATNNLPDVNDIPVSMVERMEIVADGASAIYGSDGIAGVVNIITRKSYDGTQVQARYGWGDSYNKADVNLITGKSWSGGSVVFGYEYQAHSNLPTYDRSFAGMNQIARGGHDQRGNYANPATIVFGGKIYALPGLVAGTQNLFDPNLYTDFYPKDVRHSAMLSVTQKLSDRIEGYADFLTSRRRDAQNYAQTTLALTVPNTNPYFIAPPGTNATSEIVDYWFGKELGPSNKASFVTQTTSLTAGLNVEIGGGWTGQLVQTIGWENDTSTTLGLNQTAAVAAAAGTTTATALNVFGGNSDPAVLAKLRDYAGFTGDNQMISQSQLKFDGPLIQLPGGPLKAAVGAELMRVNFGANTLNGPQTAGTGVGYNYTVSRRIEAGYGELSIPLFGDRNAIPGFQKLTLSAAGRITNYSDIGSTSNPKFGFNWQPTKDFALRGAYGTSFVAPNMWQLYNPQQAAVSVVAGLNTLVLAGGQTTLNPQKAKTYSAGIDFTPTFLPKFKASVSYFYIDYTNLLNIPLLLGGRLFTDPGLSARFLTYSPTTAQVNAILSAMPLVGVLPASGVQLILDSRASNLLATQTGGYDFAAQYTIDTSFGSLTPSVSGTTYTKFLSGVVGSAVLPSVLNTNAAIRWKYRAGLTWNKKPYDAGIFLNYVGSYNNTGAPYSAAAPQVVSSSSLIDLHLGYDLPESGWTSHTQLAIDVDNLFNTQPPFFEGATSGGYPTGFDPASASPLMRMISVAITKKF